MTPSLNCLPFQAAECAQRRREATSSHVHDDDHRWSWKVLHRPPFPPPEASTAGTGNPTILWESRSYSGRWSPRTRVPEAGQHARRTGSLRRGSGFVVPSRARGPRGTDSRSRRAVRRRAA